jgi:predicted tellurium resistance membrane protein TerC
MEDLLTLQNLFTLGMLTMLQAVLGFDNLLYITLESRRVEEGQQVKLRRLGIAIAVVLRIVLLFVVMSLIDKLSYTLFSISIEGVVHGEFNFHALIVLLGGVFILYTAVREIMHMLVVDEIGHETRNKSSFLSALLRISVMTSVFSFDSILSAIALTDVFPVMAMAIIIGGILMVLLADKVAAFLQKNRMYEVLGLFILFIVGILLLSEGGHLAHLSFFGHPITPMNTATFYFVIAILVLVDIVQSRYAKKLLMESAKS